MKLRFPDFMTAVQEGGKFMYEIMWKNIVERDRPQMKICRKRIACWIPKATNTHLVYVIVIALPLQQWLHERASVLRLLPVILL